MKKIVVFTGAGISAESGIKTFRDSNGLWEEFKIEDVATWKGWNKDRSKVIDFYNSCRRQLKNVQPNDAHKALAKLEEKYKVVVITQNVDDLHERGGSTNILHLHGELTKARSTMDPSLVYDIGYEDIKIGDKCDRGSQLRPHIVWFGEAVPMMEVASNMISDADIIIVVGTSMQVYPAANLIEYVSSNAEIYFIDPNAINNLNRKIKTIREKAGIAVPELVNVLLKNA
jgi:NAD-dependent deacetylase